MTQTVKQVFIEEFLAEAQHVYQGASMLRDGARIKRGVVGNKVHYPFLGAVRAVPKTHRAPVIPANPQWGRPEAELSDWHVADLTDVFEDIKTNVDERANLAKSFMMAIGRQEDMFVIQALESAAATAATLQRMPSTISLMKAGRVNARFNPRENFVGVNQDATTAGQTVTKPSSLVGQCLARLINNEVPENGDFKMLLPGFWYEAFASDNVIANQFYGETDISRRGLKGRKLYSHGIELIFMGDRKATSTDIQTVGAGWDPADGKAYCWEKDSIGLAYGKDPSLEVDWIPMETSWLTCMTFSAGSVAIDPHGIVQVTDGPTAIDGLLSQ